MREENKASRRGRVSGYKNIGRCLEAGGRRKVGGRKKASGRKKAGGRRRGCSHLLQTSILIQIAYYFIT